jgi:DNA (cytosine-5)-methyltransferase 1
MSLGFEQAGFDVLAAFDADPIHVATHARNFPYCKTIEADLSEVSGQEIRSLAGLVDGHIDVLFGGPPCGGFSLMGKRKLEDPRNELLGHFARLVVDLEPPYFVVENVEGLLMEPMTDFLDAFKMRVRPAGYSVVDPIVALNASDFGVPQHRRRMFMLGYRSDLAAPAYPLSPFTGEGACRRPTVWDAIGDLPNIDEFDRLLESDVYEGDLQPTESRYARIMRGEISDPEDLSRERVPDQKGLTGCRRTRHEPQTVARFADTLPGAREPISKFYRLSKDGFSTTLRAGTDESRGSHSAARPIHPVYARCITVREGARLHSMPDWFSFHHTKWHGFRQVGNAVPPLLARAVAGAILAALRRDRRVTEGNEP